MHDSSHASLSTTIWLERSGQETRGGGEFVDRSEEAVLEVEVELFRPCLVSAFTSPSIHPVLTLFLGGPSSSSSSASPLLPCSTSTSGSADSSVHTPFALRSKAARFFWPTLPRNTLASFGSYVREPPSLKIRSSVSWRSSDSRWLGRT